jgi:hypothetical protein
VGWRKEVESPDRIGIFDRQLIVHRQKKGERLNTENTEDRAQRSQRKRKTPAICRRYKMGANNWNGGRAEARPYKRKRPDRSRGALFYTDNSTRPVIALSRQTSVCVKASLRLKSSPGLRACNLCELGPADSAPEACALAPALPCDSEEHSAPFAPRCSISASRGLAHCRWQIMQQSNHCWVALLARELPAAT